ncbi:ABC transporter substrate-binding protein [Roseibium sp. CAU 1637]|uniref:ABC transporter substrate-binding protein n=1 Tax=Roseibium limicola TaxID=2816037 RepID=A0A939EM04_9HYPH|nr:ABC transporter substrate-binding protein [Roseibium limicola]MBO0345056.1 ABC transporter substrate-binding protein [Roseibium limicola]
MLLKRIAAATTVLLGTLAGAQAADWSKVRIGTEGAYPPFNTMTADGQLVGFDIDIAKALCAEMKVECEFVVQDWDGMIPALLAGKFDAIIASMSITEERKEKVDFTGKYYNTPPAIVVPKDSKLTGVTDADLDGVALGAQSSTTHSNFAEEKLPSTDLKLYPTPDEYKLDLVSGRIDAAIDDVVVLSEWLATEDGACCKILGTIDPVLEIHGEGAGIAIRKEDGDLKAMFDKAIAAIRENGTYEEINKEYFDFDVFGG